MKKMKFLIWLAGVLGTVGFVFALFIIALLFRALWLGGGWVI